MITIVFGKPSCGKTAYMTADAVKYMNNSAECLELLSGLCAMALAMGRPPEGTSYEAAGLEISSAPGKAARYEDGTVLYSCIINFKIIY